MKVASARRPANPSSWMTLSLVDRLNNLEHDDLDDDLEFEDLEHDLDFFSILCFSSPSFNQLWTLCLNESTFS